MSVRDARQRLAAAQRELADAVENLLAELTRAYGEGPMLVENSDCPPKRTRKPRASSLRTIKPPANPVSDRDRQAAIRALSRRGHVKVK